MAERANGPIDFGVWGAVIPNLVYTNLAREVWLEAKLDSHVPTFTTIMQCSTSMVGVLEAAGILRRERPALALVGGVESMSRVQIGLGQNLSDWLRRVVQARNTTQRIGLLRKLRPSDIRLFVPEVKNRVTGRSMGEHTEDMAKTWNIGRREQDELALQSHRMAVAAQDRGFFADLIIPVDGITRDHFPRRDTSLEKLAKLKPAFDRASGRLSASVPTVAWVRSLCWRVDGCGNPIGSTAHSATAQSHGIGLSSRIMVGMSSDNVG